MFKKNISNVETHIVKKVKFGIYSEKDILKSSVCEVNNLLIYDKETSLPSKNGLNDPRMGVTMRGLACQTCFGDIKECPGHFGHIKLAEIVYHSEFLETVYKVLKSICYNCSKLLITPEKLPALLQIKSPSKRLNEICKSASRVCGTSEDPGCEYIQPRYKKRKMDILIRSSDSSVFEEDSKKVFRASEVYRIFKQLDNKTIERLGFHAEYSRPEYMLIKLLIVSPPAVRPSIELSSSARSEDDLTHLYQSILSTNFELLKAKKAGQPRTTIDEIVNRLQAYTTYLINNGENKAKQKGGRPIKSISQRLKGKEGRLRGNLMGKRVDFSSRTVVSPDPSLDLDQLGVPMAIATELTVPERVTHLNIEFLKGLVERGDNWPGARYYISKAHNNEVVDLNFVKSKPNLQYGDIVERHLMNDDYVIFNRQPSLHKMSIMGHRVKVLPGSTFRLNLAVTTPYNADFDGDEMNMHVPQNLETTAEVKHIMLVPKQIITPQSNRPVMGLNQDVLLGIRLFTLKDVFVTKNQLFDLLMHLEDWDGKLPKPAIIKPTPLWTGKQILTFIIPKINYLIKRSDSSKFYFGDTSIIIKKGEHLVGTMNKDVVGPKKGSLLGCLWIDYGPDVTNKFLTSCQKLINCWMLVCGWTVGIADTIVDVSLLKVIENKRQEAKKEFFRVLQDTQKEKKELIVHQPGKTIIESFEHKVNTLLNDCRAQIGKLLNENIGNENHIKHMIISGSKGNDINISQICGLVGQQNVNGRRIPFGFYRRSLPHFLKDDYGPESRGFVANSYYKGLTPEEFFFHTMGGREGLIDTAVKTSQTGYIQRRLVKALEDVMVQYDYTVRDSNGNLVQYLYGEDGISAEFIEEQKFDILKQGDLHMREKCCFFELDENKEDFGFEDSIQDLYENDKISLEVRDTLFYNKNAHQILYDEYKNLMDIREELRSIYEHDSRIGILPVNVDRLITHSQFQNKSKTVTDLNPVYVVENLKKTLDNLNIVYIEKMDEELANFSKIQNDRALFLFRSFLAYKLCSHKVILDYKLNQSAFDYLLKEIELCYLKSKIHPGEMTGSIAAQSLGETLTQMTLNTFHFAGVSSQNITLGVPRIQEILNCAKNIKGASMNIYLTHESKYNPDKVHELISKLEFTTVGHLTKTSEIYYDPLLSETVVKDDQELLFMEEQYENYSPWVLRICIDPVLLIRKGITLKEITERIENHIPNNLQLIESLETADPIVLRLRLLNKSNNYYNDIKKVEQFILNDMNIKGFCQKVSYKRQEVKEFTSKGVEVVGLKEGEFILETSGSDIKKALRIEGVDKVRTTTNDIWDIYQNFGIEAARISIMREIQLVFSYFNIYVNYRHISLLSEAICSQGKLMAISRNGINRVYQSPFRKCSFEETVEILIKAAVFADIDLLKGVTENIMLGQLSHIGTASFDILMDSYYLLPKEEDKEKITAQWKYFPDIDPVLVEIDMEDELTRPDMQTPFLDLKTPAPMNEMGTPLYNKRNNLMSPVHFTPVLTPMMTPRPNMNISRMNSPHPGTNYSPFLAKQNDDLYNRIKSPMLPQQIQPISPHILNTNQQTIYNSGSDLKYSPSTPIYNAMQSPNTTKHLTNMSPSYAYSNSQASPYYSPNSNLSPGGNLSSSSAYDGSPMSNDAEDLMKHYYNPQSPGYQQQIGEGLKKEHVEEFSEEEVDSNDDN
jgi:DNA-directed RNA polymerase II subunit RPB1